MLREINAAAAGLEWKINDILKITLDNVLTSGTASAAMVVGNPGHSTGMIVSSARILWSKCTLDQSLGMESPAAPPRVQGGISRDALREMAPY